MHQRINHLPRGTVLSLQVERRQTLKTVGDPGTTVNIGRSHYPFPCTFSLLLKNFRYRVTLCSEGDCKVTIHDQYTGVDLRLPRPSVSRTGLSTKGHCLDEIHSSLQLCSILSKGPRSPNLIVEICATFNKLNHRKKIKGRMKHFKEI